jgi:hypothetical protein
MCVSPRVLQFVITDSQVPGHEPYISVSSEVSIVSSGYKLVVLCSPRHSKMVKKDFLALVLLQEHQLKQLSAHKKTFIKTK